MYVPTRITHLCTSLMLLGGIGLYAQRVMAIRRLVTALSTVDEFTASPTRIGVGWNYTIASRPTSTVRRLT